MVRGYIVSRHKGAVDFVKKYFKGAKDFQVISHLTAENMPKNSVVVGVFPLHIIRELLRRNNKVYIIQMPLLPPELRGKELTPAQMKKLGATIFAVNKVRMRKVV